MRKILKQLLFTTAVSCCLFGFSAHASSSDDMQTFNGHSYKVFHVTKTWTEAKEACEALGGHLVTITNENESNFVNSLPNLYSGTNYWMGGREINGTWTWVTGENWTFSRWGDNQPDNSQENTGISEDYLQICYDWGLKWNDSAVAQDRTASIGYICEWDQTLSTNEDIDKEIVTAKDNDLKQSRYELLQAKINKTTKTSLTLTWKRISTADGYMIYGNKCGTQNKYQYICTIDNPAATKYVAKGLKKGTYYKYFVVAYKNAGSEKVTITISKTIHSITKGGAYGNAKEVKITKLGKSKKNTSSITLKIGKTAVIKGYSVKQDKTIRNHRGLAFESTNPKVAKVSKKGKITAVSAGTCKIFVYAQNGVSKTIKVTVK